MIPLWFANSGEDFQIEKYPKEMIVVTAQSSEVKLKTVTECSLPVVGKEKDMIYVAFAGKRLAIEKSKAMQISGNITGKTKIKPKLSSAPAQCFHNCSKCKCCCK